MSDAAEAGKRAAAEAAVALVQDGMRLGIGTGSTMRYAIEALGRRVRAEGLRVIGIPTSEASDTLARACGIPLGDYTTIEALDLAIDGADEVETGTLRLIKGLGGALLREKIVAQSAARFVVVADGSKVVETLGAHAPLPVEIVRFAHEQTIRRIAALGGGPVQRLRDGAPFVTDGGNYVLDCAGFAPIRDPHTLDRRLRAIAGVVETGLFLEMAERAIIGEADGGTRTMVRKP